MVPDITALVTALIVLIGVAVPVWRELKKNSRTTAEALAVAAIAAEKSIEVAATIEEVHGIVNQHQTDMRAYQDLLVKSLQNAGVDVPPDASIKE